MEKIDTSIKKVLVTGGTGFIGGHVVDVLLEQGYQVSVFDRHEILEKYKNPNVEVFLGDTRDYEALSEAIAKHDGVIHMAGILGTQETIDKPIPSVETNIIGGLNVAQACRFYKKKAVYIAVGNHWMNNSYSITKTTAERFMFMYNKEHKTQIAVVRGLNAYGPRQSHAPVRKIMPNFVLPALRNQDILVYGDGEQKMDMIYVRDLADVLVRALVVEHGVYDKVFDAGTGLAPTVNQIAETVIRVVSKTNSVASSLSKLSHATMRPGEPERSAVVGDPETLRPLFGGELPKFVSLDDGVLRTVEYYRANLDRYQ